MLKLSGKLTYRTAAALIGISFLTTLATAQTAAPTDPDSIAQLSLPSQLGSISHLAEAGKLPSVDTTVILIQDAHLDYTAQKNLAKILDHLVKRYALSLVLVEGGAGNISLSGLRAWGSAEARKRMAENYLKEGLLRGEEYLDVVSAAPLNLWGVDAPDLYAANFQAFESALRQRPQLMRAIGAWRAAFEQAGGRYLSAAALDEETRWRAFESHQLSFLGYVEHLLDEKQRHALDWQTLPNLTLFEETHKLKPLVDVPAASAQQKEAIERLRDRLPPEALSNLQEINRSVKAGDASSTAFYLELDRLMQKVSLASGDFPQLAIFLRYTKLQNELDAHALLAELKSAHLLLREKLIDSSEARALLEASDRINLLEQLALLQWSDADYAAAEADASLLKLEEWVPALRAQAETAGELPFRRDDFSDLRQAWSECRRFYTAAKARDAAIVQRVVEKFRDSGANQAALIIGGFHSEHVRQMLIAQNVRVITVTPNVGAGRDEAHYTALLRRRAQYLFDPQAHVELRAVSRERDAFLPPVTEAWE